MIAEQKIYWGLGSVWFISILALLYFFADQGLVPFDPEGHLVTQVNDDHFEAHFKRELGLSEGIANTVVHFKQAACACNHVAQEHIDSVKTLAIENGFTNKTLDNVDPKNFRYIPATPAIAVFNRDGELSYFGPYSAGFSCSPGNGLVEAFLKNTVSDQFGSTVISQVNGCYCPVTPTV